MCRDFDDIFDDMVDEVVDKLKGFGAYSMVDELIRHAGIEEVAVAFSEALVDLLTDFDHDEMYKIAKRVLGSDNHLVEEFEDIDMYDDDEDDDDYDDEYCDDDEYDEELDIPANSTCGPHMENVSESRKKVLAGAFGGNVCSK